MKHFIKYFVVLPILAAACSSDEFKPADRGTDYFPLTKGFYQIYKVDSIGYSQVAGPETLAYELMVVITDSFPNQEGYYTYVLNRYKRANVAAEWASFGTWSAWSNTREMVVAEGNIPFIKLVFPVKKNIAWDGNLFNSMDEDEYEIVKLNEAFTTTTGTTFDKTLSVQQEDNDDVIVFEDRREEVYARGAGLIQKTITQLRYCTADDCRGQKIIESGTIYKQEITEYGTR